MAGKEKGGREAKKPKAEHNKKVHGQTPAAAAQVHAAVTSRKDGKT
jgi:hypothetical protein